MHAGIRILALILSHDLPVKTMIGIAHKLVMRLCSCQRFCYWVVLKVGEAKLLTQIKKVVV
jgi:hypothetical protein